ncbi:hypothetical protein GCM10009836_13730 [Pseudonocardia ailaonensis]|uniref:Uncharacterized protein n=1 Tax=Pseudonocardia ailaonensis TaxID=367279 RepID=A0ABN2MT37_9PSEU
MSRRWVWTARPEEFEGGEPRIPFLRTGEWTCDPGTHRGDLALLLRPDAGITHLLAVRSDPYPVGTPYRDFDGAAVCCFGTLQRFARPLSLDALRDDPELVAWSALRDDAARRQARVPDGVWNALLRRLGVGDGRLLAPAA